MTDAGDSFTSSAQSEDELEGSPILGEVLGDALPKMEMFHVKLREEGEKRGLIGPRELPRLWERHILNSAALAPFISELLGEARGHKLALADVGSGAGFPGIVLASMFPDITFTLIESMERRVEWLDEVVTELGLMNVQILRERAEDLPERWQFDIVTCRAVAPMTKLARWVLPLIHHGGTFVALKGRSAEAEVQKAQKEIRKAGGIRPEVIEAQVGPGLEPTHVVRLQKN